jgi:hypothetical protein
MRYIGITGPASSGKDTVARFLCETQGFVQIAFADPMVAALKAMFALTDEDFLDRKRKETVIPWIGKSPRYLLQTLGTEWGRTLIDEGIWVCVALRKVEQLRQASPCLHINGIVFSDVRRPGEADMCRSLGELWHIMRPKKERLALSADTAFHATKQGIGVLSGRDRFIRNNGSIEHLHETIAKLI